MADHSDAGSITRKTADEYAYESLAANMDGSIIYDNKEDLDAWLEKYTPSRTSRLDHVGWIMMESEEGMNHNMEDFDNLQKEWEELKQSGDPINFFSISKLAKRNQIVNGGWLFHVETGDKVDILWRKIATQFAYGILSDVATKVRVSPVDPTANKYTHVIVIKHADFTNEDEVYKLDKALRTTGIKTKLMYKPDIYSHLGIYRNNEYKIRPTIYTSQYDILKKVSKITHVYEETLNA